MAFLFRHYSSIVSDRRLWLAKACGWFVLPWVMLLSMALGDVDLNWLSVFDSQTIDFQVFWQLRLPQLLMTLIAGALLGVTGAAVQALFRNPLADPGLIGVSSGAALAAVAVMVLGSYFAPDFAWQWLMPVAAFVGGLLATLLVVWLSKSVLQTSVTGMLLLGIAVNAIAIAAIGGFKYFADGLTLRQVVYWLMGGFANVSWFNAGLLLCIALPVVFLLIRLSYGLNLLLLGDKQAVLLGIAVKQLQMKVVVLSALGVAAVVSVGGLIGYVSLIVPHFVRMLVGPDHRVLIPYSALYGAVFLTLADILARTLVAPAQLPLGVVTTLVGGPCFLLMILAYHRGRLHA